MEPIIKVRDLHYAYNEQKMALNGIDLDIYPGEKIAVIGHNGAGKSTFFLNLNGVFTPGSGEIYYKDKLITKKDLNELRRAIGIVFQDADNQIIASTVESEVSFGPMNLDLSREEVQERVDEALEYMNISDFRDRPPHYLSGGEKKRVSIADIIAMKSDIIIFDEPTAALDPLNAAMLEEVLHKLEAEGKTLLISTHDVDFAYRWTDRAIVFCGGKIIADDTPQNVFQNEEVMKKANLERPTMLDIYDILREKNMVPEVEIYPKTPEQLRDLLHKGE